MNYLFSLTGPFFDQQHFLPTSSNGNEVIRAILNLFIFFYKKISHTQKAQNAYKQTKTKNTAFFMRMKNI